jgi:hypothetical protein
VTLPKQIRFGTYVAKIIYEKQSRDHDYYSTDINKQRLTVFTEYPLETVKYELFEGIIFQLGEYSTRIVGDNKFCFYQFARILYSVIRSNPDIAERKIPEKVTIVGKIFQIFYQTQLDNPNITGDLNFSFSRIGLQDNMEKRQMFAVFWHEVIHEILHIVDDSFNKEDFVHQLAILVSELIYGNDLSWIFEEEKNDIPKVD